MPRKKLFYILGIYLAVILLLTPLLIWLIDLLYAPVEIRLTDQAEKDIGEYAGIAIPQQAQFVAGYEFPSQESIYIYIFELEAPPQSGEAATEAYVRAQFGLEDSSQYGGISPMEESLYNWCFEELEYSFTHVITYSQRSFTEICYGAQEESVYVAVIYSDI